jgi:hypothetical protein
MLKPRSIVSALIAACALGALAPTASMAKPRGPIIQLPKCYREECTPVFVCNGFLCSIEWQCVTVEVPCPIISA